MRVRQTGPHRAKPHPIARPHQRHKSRKKQSESLSERAYEVLSNAIATGRLSPGTRISEKEVASQLQISRTPVREALLRLEVEGVVRCTSRRSYNVGTLTVEDVRELYQTLAILEAAAAAGAASQITAADLKLLETYNRRMANSARRGDLPGFGAWNRRFHGVFLEKLGNQTLRRSCDSIRARLYTFPVRRSSLSQWLWKSVNEHREIIRLASARDAEGLAAFFREVHWGYEKNCDFIRDAFDRKGKGALHLA